MRPCILGTAALGLMVVAAGNAGAFCRTTTVRPPVGYDPAASGCWAQGTPIAWLWNQRVPYELAASASRQVDLADATRVADLAFSQWCRIQCPGGPPNVTTFDDGPADRGAVTPDCSSTPCDPVRAGAHHLIVFRDDGWGYDDPVNTLALTTITYAVDSGILFDAEIEINSHDHRLAVREPVPPGAFALQAILTHEAGHFLGLAHSTDPSSIMYAYYTAGSTELTADDVDGLCATYPPQDPASRWSCALAAPDGSRPALALAAALAALAWSRRRRAKAPWGTSY